MPRARSASVMVSGGMSRTTFSPGPHVSTMRPSSRQRACTAAAVGRRRELDADHEPDAADVEHARLARPRRGARAHRVAQAAARS